jgi:hypothetical protein
VAIARIQTPAAFDHRNEPFPPPFIETFSEINVMASVAIGWQRLNIIKTETRRCQFAPIGQKRATSSSTSTATTS